MSEETRYTPNNNKINAAGRNVNVVKLKIKPATNTWCFKSDRLKTQLILEKLCLIIQYNELLVAHGFRDVQISVHRTCTGVNNFISCKC